MLNEVIQANQMVFMNFWYIEHYGATFGDDFVIKKLNLTDLKYQMDIQ